MIRQTTFSIHLLLLNSQQLYIKRKTLLLRHQVFGCTCYEEEKTQWRLAVNRSKFYSNHTLSLTSYTNRSVMDTIFSKLSEKKIETNVFLNNYKKPYLQYQLCHKRQINYICYNLI